MEATVLTASPFKNSVAARLEMKKSKLEKKKNQNINISQAEPRKNAETDAEDRQKREAMKAKEGRKKKSGKPKQRNRKTSKKWKKGTEGQENSTSCLVCGETNDEDWIQCSKCCNWVHEDCADIQDALYYYCDNCITR